MSSPAKYDLVIVGAGPAGLSAALNAHRSGLNYILLEKTDHVADTIFCYLKGKFVMAEPSKIPARGDLWLEPTVREEMLNHWNEIVRHEGLNLSLNTPVQNVTKVDGSFHVSTDQAGLVADRVIMAAGTQSNPRKLGVPGEELPHVLTRLLDPEMYRDRDIVIVGAGDSAVEIALALAPNNHVTMAVRGAEFARLKPSLERAILDKASNKELTIHYKTTVEKIASDRVILKLPSAMLEVPTQVVIAKLGTFPPRVFLEKSGVEFLSSDANSPPRLISSYETNVPGLFLVGAVSGRGDLIKHAINQGYEVIEHICAREVEPADEELLKETLNFLPGRVAERIEALLPKALMLKGVAEDRIRELLLFSTFHKLSRGQNVFKQHDYSESLYIILEGAVEVVEEPLNRPEKSVATIGQGEIFGEMSLISGRRRSATVRTISDVFLWEIGRKAMLKLIYTSPPIKEFVDRVFIVDAFRTYFSRNLNESLLVPLSAKLKVRTCEKGATVFKEGDPGDALYFLRSGVVKVSKHRGTREVILAYLSAGQYFGEMALLTDQPRMATVTAVDRIEIIQVLKQDLVTLLEGAPELKHRMEEEFQRRRLSNLNLDARPELAELSRFITGEEVVVSDNVLLIDENRCIHCDNCVKACESVHEDGQTRLKRTGMKFANILVANSCRHCENPLCMTDCPPGDAIVRDAEGEVYIRDNCIACGNCARNCPYDNIFMVYPKEKQSHSLFDWIKSSVGMSEPQNKPPARSLPVKCDLCRELEGGPACVQSCPTGAVLRLTSEDYYQKIESLVAERKHEIPT